jgi:hypothetical protein
MDSFDQQCDELKDRLNTQPDLAWESIDRSLREIERSLPRHREDEFDLFREELLQMRSRRFRNEYARVEEDIDAGAITSISDLTQKMARLKRMAEPDDVTVKVDMLRRRWRAKDDVRDLQERFNTAVSHYEEAVRGGMTMAEAANRHLRVIERAREDVFQTHGPMAELDAIEAKLKEVQRIVEAREALTTMATMGQYRELIEGLMLERPDYEVELRQGGQSQGVVKRDEAVKWYRERATEFAIEKHEAYLVRAKTMLANGMPVSAEAVLRSARTLYGLPTRQLQAIEKLYESDIQPIFTRIQAARERLQSIPNIFTVSKALEAFDSALNPETGWPEFDKIDEQRAQGLQYIDEGVKKSVEISGAESNSSLVGVAREHIYGLMDSLLGRLTAQAPQLASGHRTYFGLIEEVNSQDADVVLETSLRWGDRRFEAKYGEVIRQLIKHFRTQKAQRDALLKATLDAQVASSRKELGVVYTQLAPFAELIELEGKAYPEARQLWIEAVAFQKIDLIKDRVVQAYEAGYDSTYLDGEAERVGNLVSDARSASEAQPEKAKLSGLTVALRHLSGLSALLRGLILSRDKQYGEAMTFFRMVDVDNRYFKTAQDHLAELQSTQEDNQLLSIAIREARQYIERGDYDAAYETLRPHLDKTSALNYADLLDILIQIRPVLSGRLVKQIEENIAKNEPTPEHLQRMTRHLREIDPMSANRLETRIGPALLIQKALKAHQNAKSNRDSGWQMWEMALDAWDAIESDAQAYAEQRREAHEQYVVLLVNEKLSRDTSLSMKVRKAELDGVMDKVNTLQAHYGNSKYLPLLRARVMQARLWVEEDVAVFENMLRNLRAELDRMGDSDRQDVHFDGCKRTVEVGEALSRLSRTLQQRIDVHQPYPLWRTTYFDWRTQDSAATTRPFAGWRAWCTQFFHERATAVRNTIEQAAVLWQRIIPLAKASLVSDDAPIGDLDVLWMEYRTAAQTALEDATGEYAGAIDEIIHLQQLTEAGTGFDGLLKASSHPDGQRTALIDNLIGNLMAKIERVSYIRQTAGTLRERINLAKSQGDFEQVDEDLRRITGDRASAEYRPYQRHREIAGLLAEIKESKEQLEALRTLADEARRLAELEYFEPAIHAYQQLEQPAYALYNAASFARYSDPFAQSLTMKNITAIVKRLSEKQKQIDQMRAVLSSIVDLDALMKQLRATTDQKIEISLENMQVDWSIIALVDVDARWQGEVMQLRNAGNYDPAITLATHLIGDREALRVIDQTYTLEGALSMLRSLGRLFRPQDGQNPEDLLISRTALALWRWSAVLYKAIDALRKHANQKLQTLAASHQTYKQESERFFIAYRVLTNRQQGNREENRRVLNEAYQRLTGKGLTMPASDLYPLAPDDEKFDVYYQEAIKRR